MPGYRTVYDWQAANEQFAASIARAREEGFDVIALDALDILDQEPERVVTTIGDDRSESRIDGASVQRAKNRFEGRMKLLAKWDPKRYGDKTLIGSDPENPIPAGFAIRLVSGEMLPRPAKQLEGPDA